MDTIFGDKREEEEDSKTESPALTGSLSALYGGVNPYLYSQFNLHIREQKINQITLLKVMSLLVVSIKSQIHIKKPQIHIKKLKCYLGLN